MRSTILSVLAFVGLALAQEQYSIDPNSVPLATRQSWCQSQQTQCPLLCLQMPGNSASTTANNCDPKTLTYQCSCASGTSPNATEYSQTLPYYICQEWGTQCVAACGNDNSCSNDCRANHPCGAQDPVRVNSTSSSTMAATATNTKGGATGTSGLVTGFGGAASTSTAGSNGKSAASTVAVNFGASYGLAVVFAGVFAGFAILL